MTVGSMCMREERQLTLVRGQAKKKVILVYRSIYPDKFAGMMWR
jgi:hypothetical protein